MSAAARARRGGPRRRWRVAALAVLGLLAAGVALVALRPGLVLDAGRALATWRAGARSGSVVAGGTRLAYLELGSGRPLVLQHGLRAEAVTMLPLARELAPAGYRVLMIELPGHGHSAPPAAPLSIDTAGELVLEAAQRLGAGPRPVLVGHSMGGWILGWQALERPGSCGPLVLVSSAGVVFEPPPEEVLLPTTLADSRRSLEVLFADTPRVPSFLLWLTAQRPTGTSRDLLRSGWTGQFLLEGRLARLEVPALVVFGAADRLIPPAAGRRLAAELPGDPYVEIPGAGHMIIWEKPRELARVIDRFARQAPR